MTIDFAAMALAAVRVLLVGIVLGAGLPALFAVGIRLQAVGAGDTEGGPTRRRPALVGLAWIAFAIVLLVVIAGVLYITRLSIYHYFGVSLFGAGS
jgi:hypothetical protein